MTRAKYKRLLTILDDLKREIIQEFGILSLLPTYKHTCNIIYIDLIDNEDKLAIDQTRVEITITDNYKASSILTLLASIKSHYNDPNASLVFEKGSHNIIKYTFNITNTLGVEL